MKKITVLGVAATVAAFLSATALGFDREPVRLRQLKPDGWGDSTNGAARSVRTRYDSVGSTYCVGVIMVGHEADSSWIHGMTRYWDKLVCLVDEGNDYVTFVYDPKGSKADAFNIYRLRRIPK